MDWLSVLQDVFKTIASKTVLSGLALLGGVFLAKLLKPSWEERLLPLLRAWWGRRSSQGRFLAGVVGFVLLAAAVKGAFVGTQKPPPARAATPFAIVVADLEGDTNRHQTHHIRDSLETQFGDAIRRGEIEILMRGETLEMPPDGDLKTALETAAGKGRAWLKEQNASVLIWGAAKAPDKVLWLRFLAAEGDGSPKSYALNERTLELPADFGGDLGTVFAAQAAAAISPVYDRSGEALANLIAPFVERLKPLAERPPESFSDETRAQLWHAYAIGEARLGEERGDNARLASAIAFYKKTLMITTRDKVPLLWAMTQNDLGNALSRLGERQSGTARLEEAIAAYREALKEVTRERMPLEFAATQNNLGLALWSFCERESGTARLEEAVAAYRVALLELTRESVPLQWATTQNNLGNALSTLGERKSERALLEEAARAYRAALLEWTRDKVPLGWAMAQNNLGNVLRMLGERESGTARLEEAVAAFRAALRELTRERVPLHWAGTQHNLGAVLRALGERDGGTARFEQAVAAYREALEERTRERVPLDWALTQNNLGAALWKLGERESETDKVKICATLKEVRGHYSAALEEFQRSGASHYVALAQGNITGLDHVIARLCGG